MKTGAEKVEQIKQNVFLAWDYVVNGYSIKEAMEKYDVTENQMQLYKEAYQLQDRFVSRPEIVITPVCYTCKFMSGAWCMRYDERRTSRRINNFILDKHCPEYTTTL